MSAIHKRIYVSLKHEFKMLGRIFKTYLPAEYPYDVVGGTRQIKQQDFDDKIDILPIADPNIFSQSQRISIAQAELQLAQSNPQMHNMYNAYRAMYEALGVKILIHFSSTRKTNTDGSCCRSNSIVGRKNLSKLLKDKTIELTLPLT